MELDFDHPVALSKAEAIRLVGQFFSKEWKNLKEEDISISRCQTGVNNEVYFVSRVAENGITEPNKVVIRKYSSVGGSEEIKKEMEKEMAKDGGHMDFKAPVVEQIVIQMELADRGLGPQLYGIFDGGRIEELIDCRKITFAEARDPVLEADIAVNMARIHATRLPLRKPNYLFIDILRHIHGMLRGGLPYYQSLGNELLLSIVTHDYPSEFQKLEPLLSFRHNRMVLMNWDPHLDNIAVLNHPRDGQLKTMIFDYEMAGYNTRGKDLGLFLISRSGFFPIATEDQKLESNEQFFPFLRAYQQEVVKEFAGEDIDVNGIDSLDHLMAESLIGGMVSCLKFLLLISGLSGKMSGKGEFVEKAMKLIPSLFRGFIQCRDALAQRYPQLELLFDKDP